MAYNGVVYAGALLDINYAAAGSLTVLGPLLSSVDQSLFGPLGIGALQSNLQAQLSSSLQASANISLNILNPLAGFQQALLSITQLQATILKALSSGSIPAASLQVTTQLATMAAFAASIDAQISGLKSLIQSLLGTKIPAVSFAGALASQLSAGGAFVLSFDGVALASAGSSVAADFAAGIAHGAASIGAGETVYGLVIVTKVPSTWASLQAILRT